MHCIINTNPRATNGANLTLDAQKCARVQSSGPTEILFNTRSCSCAISGRTDSSRRACKKSPLTEPSTWVGFLAIHYI